MQNIPKIGLTQTLTYPPVRRALSCTEFSLEFCRELCSLLFPVSTICFIDIPPHGSPERFWLVSMLSGSGDVYELPARC